LKSSSDISSEAAIILALTMANEGGMIRFARRIASIQDELGCLICGKCPFDWRNVVALLQRSSTRNIIQFHLFIPNIPNGSFANIIFPNNRALRSSICFA